MVALCVRGKEPLGSDLDATAEELQAWIIQDARTFYSEEVVRRWLEGPNFGRIERADGHCRFTGPCGDTMEIFLSVSNGHVARATFMTDGCAATVACGSVACDLVAGKALERVGEVTQEEILAALGGLPEEFLHCALLAATTLKAAAAEIEGPRANRSDGGPP